MEKVISVSMSSQWTLGPFKAPNRKQKSKVIYCKEKSEEDNNNINNMENDTERSK